ncbi:MAG: hypothetical protein ACLFNO_04025 [Parcubacteria group bacterium]
MQNIFLTINVLAILFSGVIIFGVGFFITYFVMSSFIYNKKIRTKPLFKTFLKALPVYFLMLIIYFIITSTAYFPGVILFGMQVIIIVLSSLWFLTPAFENTKKEVKIKTYKPDSLNEKTERQEKLDKLRKLAEELEYHSIIDILDDSERG